MEEHASAVTDDLAQLWRRVAFSILISNTDDHLRNHAFLHSHGGTWTLSPAFDLNPDPDHGPKHLSTAIDGDTLADVRDLLEVAPLFRLDRAGALRILGQVRNVVRRWPQVAAGHGLGKAEVAAMAPAFDDRQAAVADQVLTARGDEAGREPLA